MRRLLFAVVLVELLLWSSDAAGQDIAWKVGDCKTSVEADRILHGEYGETVAVWGMTDNGKLMELWSADNETWTVTIRFPNGAVCLVGAGVNLRYYKHIKPKGLSL